MLDQNNERIEENRTVFKQEKKPKWGGFLKTIAAGMIGSALTLTAAPYLPVPENNNSAAQVAENSGTETPAKVEAQQVSAAGDSLADTVEQASKAIVGIVNIQQQSNPFSRQSSGQEVESGTGSGVIIQKTDGGAYIVTNNHVIENASKIEVTLHDGEKAEAELVGTDPLTDIAVLKVSGNVGEDILPFGDSANLRAGDQVLAIGNPLGLDLSRTVTQGIVSAVDRSIAVSTSAGEWELDVIQTDAAINPGNSGGALINTAGELVGINSLKISNSGVEGLGFAIPSNEVKTLVDELIKNGEIVRPYLGVGLASLDEIPQFYQQSLPENIESGAIITNIDQSSSAAKAGLQAEDIIVSIGGKAVTGPDDLRKALYTDFKIGDEVEVKYYREGQEKTVKITLQSRGIASEE